MHNQLLQKNENFVFTIIFDLELTDIFAENYSFISSVAEPDPFVFGLLLDPDPDPAVSGADPSLDPGGAFYHQKY
jgi:hypothetical protein